MSVQSTTLLDDGPNSPTGHEKGHF